jgi:hypothetical protein
LNDAARLVTVLCIYFCLNFLNAEAHRQNLSRAYDGNTLSEMAGAWLLLGFGFAFAFASNQQLRTKDA